MSKEKFVKLDALDLVRFSTSLMEADHLVRLLQEQEEQMDWKVEAQLKKYLDSREKEVAK